MGDETEIKLDLTGEGVAAIERSGLLGAGDEIAQRAIYFDTPDHALFADGMILRIRQENGRRAQTLKVADRGGAGLFSRPEWTLPVPDDRPVIDRRLPLPHAVRDLAPVFVIETKRRCWHMLFADARFELAVDRGSIHGDAGAVRFDEAEFELHGGSVRPLFAFARLLDAVTPVRIGVLSKAERGYRLLQPAVKSCKAEPVALDPDMAAAEAFQRIAQSCLRQYRLNETILLERREPEAVHQARVALRRLRSAIAIFAALLTDEESLRLDRAVRSLARTLGAARNADVLGTLITGDRWRPALNDRRTLAYGRVEETLASSATRRLLLDLAEWLAVGAWLSCEAGRGVRSAPARNVVSDALDHLSRRVRHRARRFPALSAKERHTLRKQVKRLRYATEFVRPLFPGTRAHRRHERYLGALLRLQDDLGELNDLRMVDATLSDFGVRAAKRKRGSRVRHKAARALAKLAATKPFWPPRGAGNAMKRNKVDPS